MDDFMDIVKSRRSVRRFEEKDIPEHLVDTVLESVQWSPSWANTQCWEVVMVKDQAIKEKLQETIAPKNPATKATAHPSGCLRRGSGGFRGRRSM